MKTKQSAKRTRYTRATLAAIAAFQEVDKGFDDYLAHDLGMYALPGMTAQMQKLAKTLADATRIVEAMNAKKNSRNSCQK